MFMSWYNNLKKKRTEKKIDTRKENRHKKKFQESLDKKSGQVESRQYNIRNVEYKFRRWPLVSHNKKRLLAIRNSNEGWKWISDTYASVKIII